jgi:hypothetical protein
MRKLIIPLIILVFASSNVFAYGGCPFFSNIGKHVSLLDDVDVEVEGGTLIMTCHDDNYSRIEITEDYNLYLDGELVVISKDQKRLVEDYYDSMIEVIDDATTIGIKGAELGLAGAKIGIKAVANVWKLLLPGYDSDDFEEAIEREAEALERKAEKLEIQADLLEVKAHDAEDAFEEMIEGIPELYIVYSGRNQL